MIDLAGTPYLIDVAAAQALAHDVKSLQERVDLLRHEGKLTQQTLESYYGEKRFEQVAESNAIEGSTLDVGETELAVTRGITITGHDPGYVRDARTLYSAIVQLAQMAKEHRSTDVAEVKQLHEMILGERPAAGHFRSEQIRITGTDHRPPRSWREVMDGMEQWEAWSRSNPSVPPLVRAVVLHAWLTHVHPFVDGNGRTARAIMNLELIRGGYPPVIIRARKDRDRYIEALHSSDAGDLGPFFELVIDRAEDALRDLERAATKAQGYDQSVARIRQAQEHRLAIWQAAVSLLIERLRFELDQRLSGTGAKWSVFRYEDTVSVDDYIQLCQFKPIRNSWIFRIECEIPGLPKVTRLAWAGFRSIKMRDDLAADASPAPSLYWSKPNSGGYPPWTQEYESTPGGAEMTLVEDRWFVRTESMIKRLRGTELAAAIADATIKLATRT